MSERNRRTWWRVGQWVIGAAIVLFAGKQLAQNWAKLREQPLNWEIRPAYIIAAVVLTWAMYGTLIQAWRLILRGWDAHLGMYTAARIWTVSSLGKYIPGKVWAIAGMAVMAQRVGITPWVASGGSVLLQALAVAAGGAIVGITGITVLESQYPWFRPALLVLGVASGLGIGLLLWRPFTDRLFRLVGVSTDRPTNLEPGVLAAAFLANLVAWIGYGGTLWLLTRGLLPNVSLSFPVAIGAFTASYLAGFLALFAPGGLVVREGTLFLMLQGAIGPAAAGALAIASRVMLTFTEFGAAAFFVVRPGESSRVVNSRTGTNPE